MHQRSTALSYPWANSISGCAGGGGKRESTEQLAEILQAMLLCSPGANKNIFLKKQLI